MNAGNKNLYLGNFVDDHDAFVANFEQNPEELQLDPNSGEFKTCAVTHGILDRVVNRVSPKKIRAAKVTQKREETYLRILTQFLDCVQRVEYRGCKPYDRYYGSPSLKKTP